MTQLDFAALANTYLIPWATRIVLTLVVFIVGRWLARWLTRTLQAVLRKGKLDDMLVRFLGNIAYFALLAVVALAALEQLGVNTTSAMAVLGAAGLAVGLALKDSLANFSSGVMLIIFRPFRIGDFVELAGTSGMVEEIQMFNTVLRTPDNREVTIPNGQIYNDVIVNYSARDTRRIDLVFGIGYGDDIPRAREILEGVMSADERILKDPEPAVMVLELGESSIDLAARPWVKSADYWAVRSDLLETVKARFDGAGITIPYPQRDVRLFETRPAA